MRLKALLLAVLMLSAGCLGGGSDDDAGTPEAETIEPNTGDSSTTGNATGNATYLQNTDYNQTHVHDYWPGNSTEKVIMDEVIETNLFLSAFYTAFSPLFDEPKTSVGTIWFSLPNGSFVPEGTGELVVEVDATGALEGGQQVLSYTPANSASWTELDPQDAQAEWLIELTPEMADLPHAKSTRWGFQLEADGTGAVLDGEINVKITANKLFDLEAWPEHEDFWEQGERNHIELFTAEDTFDRTEQQFTRFVTGDTQEEADIPFPEGTIVPPETSVLLVNFWYALDDAPKNNANGDVELAVKLGSSSSWYEPMDWQYMIREEEGYKQYAVPVDGSNWDSPYAEQSAWAFNLNLPSGLRDPVEGDARIQMGTGIQNGAGNYTLEAHAYRDVPGWLEGQMDGDDF